MAKYKTPGYQPTAYKTKMYNIQSLDNVDNTLRNIAGLVGAVSNSMTASRQYDYNKKYLEYQKYENAEKMKAKEAESLAQEMGIYEASNPEIFDAVSRNIRDILDNEKIDNIAKFVKIQDYGTVAEGTGMTKEQFDKYIKNLNVTREDLDKGIDPFEKALHEGRFTGRTNYVSRQQGIDNAEQERVMTYLNGMIFGNRTTGEKGILSDAMLSANGDAEIYRETVIGRYDELMADPSAIASTLGVSERNVQSVLDKHGTSIDSIFNQSIDPRIKDMQDAKLTTDYKTNLELMSTSGENPVVAYDNFVAVNEKNGVYGNVPVDRENEIYTIVPESTIAYFEDNIGSMDAFAITEDQYVDSVMQVYDKSLDHAFSKSGLIEFPSGSDEYTQKRKEMDVKYASVRRSVENQARKLYESRKSEITSIAKDSEKLFDSSWDMLIDNDMLDKEHIDALIIGGHEELKDSYPMQNVLRKAHEQMYEYYGVQNTQKYINGFTEFLFAHGLTGEKVTISAYGETSPVEEGEKSFDEKITTGYYGWKNANKADLTTYFPGDSDIIGTHVVADKVVVDYFEKNGIELNHENMSAMFQLASMMPELTAEYNKSLEQNLKDVSSSGSRGGREEEMESIYDNLFSKFDGSNGQELITLANKYWREGTDGNLLEYNEFLENMKKALPFGDMWEQFDSVVETELTKHYGSDSEAKATLRGALEMDLVQKYGILEVMADKKLTPEQMVDYLSPLVKTAIEAKDVEAARNWIDRAFSDTPSSAFMNKVITDDYDASEAYLRSTEMDLFADEKVFLQTGMEPFLFTGADRENIYDILRVGGEGKKDALAKAIYNVDEFEDLDGDQQWLIAVNAQMALDEIGEVELIYETLGYPDYDKVKGIAHAVQTQQGKFIDTSASIALGMAPDLVGVKMPNGRMGVYDPEKNIVFSIEGKKGQCKSIRVSGVNTDVADAVTPNSMIQLSNNNLNGEIAIWNREYTPQYIKAKNDINAMQDVSYANDERARNVLGMIFGEETDKYKTIGSFVNMVKDPNLIKEKTRTGNAYEMDKESRDIISARLKTGDSEVADDISKALYGKDFGELDRIHQDLIMYNITSEAIDLGIIKETPERTRDLIQGLEQQEIPIYVDAMNSISFRSIVDGISYRAGNPITRNSGNQNQI